MTILLEKEERINYQTLIRVDLAFHGMTPIKYRYGALKEVSIINTILNDVRT